MVVLRFYEMETALKITSDGCVYHGQVMPIGTVSVVYDQVRRVSRDAHNAARPVVSEGVRLCFGYGHVSGQLS